MKYLNFSQALLVSRVWNFLDVSYISGILSDKVVYESFGVQNPLVGKENLLQHMELKLETVWNAVQSGDVQLYAQIIAIEGIFHECFVKLNQIVKGQCDESIISISVNEDGTIYLITINPLLPNLITHEIYPEE